ncbi:cyclic nucleotide-binding domain-containing protein [Enterococcus sp. MJM12]|uniref:Cyclic nucleotide-binding domain-containing protein n=1 Tax=Candidatus Enterococcus myersii TaxID=2815322 RepID=A0ABS3H3X6_9ENTE|nr:MULTISPECIES: cyclic nucleotide-binding domain-containing protein [Enterococcus]MBO0448099.1 cyclic nucleotide-binding domain-containing protein [Enterococcus sp. MJM12]MCD1024730.1 cyclic nucleotide-binding domain-containing protein [Enterococcus sp. SMC-9]MDT2740252.1 cyclic nucleotide-binding domain-containing protein [Enterococcus canintestini]WHA08849.1 cyclic nucleotide-binding domain-containing protein [Enterococcus montenegrensis]
MKQLFDKSQLKEAIATNNLQDYLSTDLLSIATLCTFEKDEDLIQAGTASKYLYFLVEGSAMVYSFTYDTQNICINYCYEATIIGEASSLWETTPSSSVKAMTPCTCVCINLKQYRSILQNDLRFLKHTCQLLSYRLNTGINLANSLSEPVETRLARFILEHEKDELFSFQLNNCAAILNVSYRHLLRTMTNFKDQGILQKVRGGYRILKRSQLLALTA